MRRLKSPDAAVQALSFHMAALGFTIPRDGWRFEPVTGEPFKFVCRGQVTPDRTHHLKYEVFVEEVINGPTPTVYAALLCTADGLKVFHCRRFGVRLVPDWPLSTRQNLIADLPPAPPVRPDTDIRGDYAALLACAWGSPSQAFGEMYRRYDGGRVPRLPGPPYHFMTRVFSIDTPPASMKAGCVMRCEFDVDPNGWYFTDGGQDRMPYTALLEALLQPCGWVASFMGVTLGDQELLFRNLDGDGATPRAEIGRDAGTLSVKITVLNVATSAAMRLVFFRVESSLGETPVLAATTSFGFFPPESFRSQAGLPISPEQAKWRDAPSNFAVDLRPLPPRFFAHAPRIASGLLHLLDGIDGYWPQEGAAGLGRVRARKVVDPRAWYFKAHFFQDPVQPGPDGHPNSPTYGHLKLPHLS
jgi:3-hydroxymyristoyl/3-hydroxydecanoyl-(acyl carrier protein) dehydratase